MAVTHSTTVVVADDGTSPVGTNEWNADHVTATVSLSGTSANKDQLLIPDTTAGAGLTIGGDTNLYRAGADILKTDDSLVVASSLTADYLSLPSSNGYVVAGTGVAANSPVFYARASGDGANRFILDNSGKILWGDGTSAGDTNLYRSAANELMTDDSLVVAGSIKQSTTKVVLDTDHTAAADPHSTYFKTISFGGNLS